MSDKNSESKFEEWCNNNYWLTDKVHKHHARAAWNHQQKTIDEQKSTIDDLSNTIGELEERMAFLSKENKNFRDRLRIKKLD